MTLKKIKVPVQSFSVSSAKSFLGYAFGLTEKPGPHAILEVGSTTLRVLECIREDASLRLLGVHLKEISPQNLSVVAQEEVLRKEVKTFLGGIRLSSKRATLGFSSGLIPIRKVTVPEMPKEELPKAIRWAVKPNLSFDAERAMLGFEGSPSGEKKQDILLAIADEARLNGWVMSIQERGLQVTEIASAPLSLLQWVKTNALFPVDATAILDLGTFHSSLFVLAAGKVLFIRDFPIGGEDVTQAMTQVLTTERGVVHLLSEEAERLKRSYGFPSEEITGETVSRTQLVSLIRPVLERLAGELQRSLDYFRQESDLHVKRMFLVGGGSQLKELDRFLQEKLNLPVEKLSFPPELFFSKGQQADETLAKNFPLWATTLAMAARRPFGPLDLLPARFREKKSERIERVAIRMISFALFLTLLVTFIFKVSQNQVLEKEKQYLKADRLKIQEIQLLQDKIQQRKALTSQLLKDHPFFLGTLKEISHSLPPNAVMDYFDYDPPSKTLSLSGTIFATEGHATEELLSELISNWEKSPFFKEVLLISSERDTSYDRQASNFQIHCTLTVP